MTFEDAVLIIADGVFIAAIAFSIGAIVIHVRGIFRHRVM